jgi:endonuclease-3
MYGEPTWVAPRHDPVDELVLTILSQHTSDLNAERAYRDLRARYATWDEVEHAPLEELRAAIVRAGLAIQKAPRIQAALWHIREHAGGYSLEFLREMEPLDARAWLTAIPGTGVKTASVVLLFCFDMPLSPVDTHVDRVSRRIGMIGPNVDVVAAHDRFLEFTPPELAYELHVNLITHGRQTCTALRPKCGRCAVAPRCRYVDPRAP